MAQNTAACGCIVHITSARAWTAAYAERRPLSVTHSAAVVSGIRLVALRKC